MASETGRSQTGPHSRACGFRQHDHGPACHTNCPTCQGRSQTPEPYPLYAFCAEQLPDDWRELSSGIIAHTILTAAQDPAAPDAVCVQSAQFIRDQTVYEVAAWLGRVGYAEASEAVLGTISERDPSCTKPCCTSDDARYTTEDASQPCTCIDCERVRERQRAKWSRPTDTASSQETE